MPKILIAEDDPSLCRVLFNALTEHNYAVEVANDGVEAWNRLRLYQYDLLILDWSLPLRTGVEICRKFRAQGGNTPILMLTGKQELEDKTVSFRVGVDDYLTKPFEMEELLLRLNALLRRPPVIHVERLTAGDVVLETDTHKVTKSGKEIVLQPKEFALLEFLMRNRGAIFDAEQLLKAVWKSEEVVGTETVRTHIKKLRAKLDHPDAPSIIVNIFAVGYKIE